MVTMNQVKESALTGVIVTLTFGGMVTLQTLAFIMFGAIILTGIYYPEQIRSFGTLIALIIGVCAQQVAYTLYINAYRVAINS